MYRMNSVAPHAPVTVPPRVLRAGLGLAVVAALLSFAVRVQAQPITERVTAQRPAADASAGTGHQGYAPKNATLTGGQTAFAAVPFAVGEELVFHATFGKLPAGTARMRVNGIDTVRGRVAYHVAFTVDGGIPFFRVHDRYESWIDVETLSSLRYTQTISEGRYHRTTTYELFPERAEYQRDAEDPQPSVVNPLDDGSFIYAVRAANLRAGDTLRANRYFMPGKNPVVLTGLRDDTITVGAGTYATTVIRPTIKTNGIFSDDGNAEVWFSKDEQRLPVQLKTKFSKFTLVLTLQSVTGGTTVPVALAKR